MGTLTFNGNSSSTIGVEVELGLCNGHTGALSSSVQEVLGNLPPEMLERTKPELMQCYVEITQASATTSLLLKPICDRPLLSLNQLAMI